MNTIAGHLNELKSRIADWENRYLLRFPIAGKVQYLEFWADEQYVQLGTPVFSVVPKENHILGRCICLRQGRGRCMGEKQ
ncbi:hypothetical protein [Chitinophaga sancti]|uniref:HlyD family secretion protein n=1 Tax=Chitinophaga sancti TaxID=1004 RepID=A0ABZ0XKF7_9BACT|nr:hypothetical protein [Chitinophaga sancti]WQD63228.1 hypothetical protein U0033_02395 [Chitinophaga sancti]WQG91146.1 hypothetical protein SR876_06520 [Chitinophaga sancti]